MIALLKIIHFVALAVGVGGAAANMIAMPVMKAADGPAKAAVGTSMRLVAQAAAISLIVLWLSGIVMVYAIWGGWAALPAMFWVKLLDVIALTVVSGTVQYRVLSGTPLPPPRMAVMAKAGFVFAFGAVILAVIAFSG